MKNVAAEAFNGSRRPYKCLVVGGTKCHGLDRAIVRLEAAAGRGVRAFNVRPEEALGEKVEYVTGDLLETLSDAGGGAASAAAPAAPPALLADVDVVFHVAAPGNSASPEEYRKTIVASTQALLDACLRAPSVRAFVFTSDAAVACGLLPALGVDETTPLPLLQPTAFLKSKLEAETLVLRANTRPNFTAAVLRPLQTFGFEDCPLVEAVCEQGRLGRLVYAYGDAAALCDYTYVENVADAHVLAGSYCLHNIAPYSDDCRQEGITRSTDFVFHISNRAPIRPFAFLGMLAAKLGFERPRYRFPMMWALGASLVVKYLLRSNALTPLIWRQRCLNYSVSCEKAVRVLGYCPRLCLEAAVARVAEEVKRRAPLQCAIVPATPQPPGVAVKILYAASVVATGGSLLSLAWLLTPRLAGSRLSVSHSIQTLSNKFALNKSGAIFGAAATGTLLTQLLHVYKE
eukprot:GHVU01225143.1.p1 GENE.GHVU01225143.1~~GHVU01225143.1.p1  ORF type:complete len:459 (-),score=93.63 GHVU01225143.1:156-1532(-)